MKNYREHYKYSLKIAKALKKKYPGLTANQINQYIRQMFCQVQYYVYAKRIIHIYKLFTIRYRINKQKPKKQ